MALISLQNIAKQFDYTPIFTHLTLHIHEGERIGVIGHNGCGKSTLLNMIQSKILPDSGEINIQGDLHIAALPQKPIFKEGISVKDAILEELQELKKAKEELEILNIQLGTDFNNKELLKRHSELTSYLDHHNAWDLESKLERILIEFKLKEHEHSIANLLSGGEQKRVALAGLLLFKPDVLLLDEPTNHLDVQMVEFLEELILKEKYTLIFISHDRYFIDHVATRTVEIDNGTLRSFDGGYGDYLKAKEALLQAMSKEHENLLKLLKNEEEWLRRGVQARRKRNEGRKQRVLELRENAKKNPSLIRKMQLELEREQKHFNQTEGVNRQKMLFELEHLNLKVGQKELLTDLSLRILQKDRMAIVGRNGSGKSSFLKMLLGEIAPHSGNIKRGDVQIGYFDQQRRMLDNSKNLIETFCPFGGDRVEVKGKSIHIYGYLKNFLFPKEYLDKKIGVLSGGEKSRIALALLFTKNYDCLILDEPTNDLDIQTMNILEEYLLSFQGALLIVSHDRYFIDKIAKNLLVFDGYGNAIPSAKSFSEFLEDQKEIFMYQNLYEEILTIKEESAPSTKQATKLSYNEQRALEALPAEIEKIEIRLKELETLLYNPPSNDELLALSQEYNQLQNTLNDKLEQYIALEEKREELERRKQK